MATGEWGSLTAQDGSVTTGLRDCDLTQLGIPTAEEYFRMYCLHMGIPPTENWNFYMAFSFFRVAAILQGVYRRFLTGNGVAWESQLEGPNQLLPWRPTEASEGRVWPESLRFR